MHRMVNLNINEVFSAISPEHMTFLGFCFCKRPIVTVIGPEPWALLPFVQYTPMRGFSTI